MKNTPIKIEKQINLDKPELIITNISRKIVSVKWYTLKHEIRFTKCKYAKPIDKLYDIKKHTQSFRFYENFGYSINDFSEFLIIADKTEYTSHIPYGHNNIKFEVSEVSPMGKYIFGILHKSGIHPEFEACRSIKFFGTDSENIEIYLLLALNELVYNYKKSFNICSLDYVNNNIRSKI